LIVAFRKSGYRLDSKRVIAIGIDGAPRKPLQIRIDRGIADTTAFMISRATGPEQPAFVLSLTRSTPACRSQLIYTINAGQDTI